MSWKQFISQKFEIVEGVTIYVDKVLLALLILLGTWLAVKVLRRAIIRPNFIVDKIDAKRRMTIFLLMKYLGWFVSIFVSLNVAGIDITALMLGSTAVLVGLGLGLQNIFKDLVSGLFLLFEGSLKIGDVIEVDGIVGKVLEINLRSSEILTRDDVTIIIPNSKFVGERVVNWSHDNDKVRFTVHVNVAYDSDVDKLVDCLIETMNAHPAVEKKPAAMVQFTEFGESSLGFEMLFWSRDAFRIEKVKSDMRKEVYVNLKKQGLNIPYPQRDLHIKGIEKLVNLKETNQ
jgi:small-conductance mechanosensitive channel